jgi:hypothetical protein
MISRVVEDNYGYDLMEDEDVSCQEVRNSATSKTETEHWTRLLSGFAVCFLHVMRVFNSM